MAIFVELVYGGQMRNLSNAEVFNQYCLVDKAQRMGLTASNKEIADLIRKTPAFQTNGEFDAAKRQDILKRLRANGITEELINDSFRDQVIISKLQRELSSGITVSDNEIETLYRTLNAVNLVKYAQIKVVSPKVNTIKEEEAKNYFVANRGNYMIPGSVGALIVEFPFSKYVSAAQSEAKDAKLLEQFFRANIAEFATEKNPAPKFADVKAQVVKKFVEAQSQFLARKAGYEFASSVYDESNGKDERTQLSAFARKASELKYKVISAAPVKFDSDTIGKIKNAELVRQLTHSTGNSLVTNAVNGDKAVYVAIAANRKAPRKAEYKEVAAQVKKDCALATGRKNAQLEAQKAFAQIAKLPVAKREAELAKISKSPLKSVSFSFVEMPGTPEAYTMAQVTSNIKVGEVAPPFPTGDSVNIAMLVKRTAADMKKFAAEKDKFAALCRNRKLQLAILAIQEDLNRNCVFSEPNQQ